MTHSFKFLILAACGGASLTHGQTTVYQDTFDGDGIDTNTGVGGGGVAIRYRSGTSFEWHDDETTNGLEAGATGIGNQITTFHSEESFNISEGFTLQVVFRLPSTGTSPTPANHLSFGLTTRVAVDANDTGVNSGFFASSNTIPTADGIGFSFGTRNNNVDEGLIAWDANGSAGNGLYSALAAISFDSDATAPQTITLEVDSAGNYTYTYDSLTAGTVTGTGTTTIDLDQTYHFRTRTQGSSGNAIESILLTTESAQFDPPTISTSASVYDLGDSITYNVTFDPSSEILTLITPTGNVDLLAIDLNDAAPGDGQVAYSEAPALGVNSYQVTATRTGVADLSVSTDLLVIDPSTEAPDNAFSTAIKADSPLFYYRFEDLMDSNSDIAPETIFIRDSSGNDYHVGSDGIQGGVSVVAGPDGMQNSANFAIVINNGARGILSPAASQIRDSYTFVSVLNVNERSTGNPRHLLSMASEALGGTNGSPIIQWLSNFRTSLDGTQSLSEVDALAPNTSCLVHAVFTADDINGGGEMALYIDGEAVGTPVTIATIPDNSGNWIIGATQIFQDPSWFDFIDETAIFETALSETQITAHATAFFSAVDPFLGFDSDVTEIVWGESVELSWKVSDAVTAVTINGNPVEGDVVGGAYTMTVSPRFDTTYTIEVTGPGGPFTESIDVTVTGAPPANPNITSIFLDDAIPPNVTLDLTGEPNTVYYIYGSIDLADDFPFEMADEVSLNEQGEATITFPSFEDIRFFRAALPSENE